MNELVFVLIVLVVNVFDPFRLVPALVTVLIFRNRLGALAGGAVSASIGCLLLAFIGYGHPPFDYVIGTVASFIDGGLAYCMVAARAKRKSRLAAEAHT